MADLSYSVDVNTTGAVAGLQKLQDKVGALSKTFGNLQTAIAGLMLGATIKSAVAYADAISDLSVATNIAVENILGFTDALEQNGGNAEGAQKALVKFGMSIGEAADGSDKAQNAFARVGVSLTDLRTLSEKDLLAKTIKGLAQISDTSTRAAAQMAVFGKSTRGVDMVGVYSGYAAATAESQKYAESVRQAGMVSDKLASAFNKFQLELIKSLGPMADFIEKLKPEQIQAFVEAIVKIGGAAAGLTAITKVFGWLSAGGAIAFAVIKAGIGGVIAGTADMAAAWAVIAKTFEIAWNYITGAIKGTTTMWAAAEASGTRFTLLIAKLAARFGYLAEGVALFVGGAAAFATGLGEVLAVIAMIIAAWYSCLEVADLFFDTKHAETFRNSLGTIWQKMKDIIGLKKEVDEGPKGRTTNQDVVKAQIAYGESLRKEIETTREVIAANAAKIHAIQQASKAYAEHNDEVLKGIAFENSLVGKTDEETQVMRAQKSVMDDAAAAVKKLTDEKLAAQAALKPGETSMNSYYDAEIKKINESAAADARRLGIAVTGNQGLKAIEKARLQDIENITKAIEDQIARQQTLGGLLQSANDKKVDVGFEGAQAKRSPLEQQFASIQEEARKAALEAGRAFSAAFEDSGDGLSSEKAQELADGLARIRDMYQGIANAQTENLNASRSWEAGWKDAFDAYVEHATNAATRAGETFNAITSNMNSAIDNFVDNGKFSFEDFASSVIKDLIKIEAKALMMEGLKGLFGEKGGGGGLLSTIGSFIGGFFADGGSPPVGKASIVGERGPELFVPKQAGTIVPNNALGGGGGQQITNNNTTVNHYTVNAVDAKSVAQLFAENRKQLLGTVRMAQAEQPYASRL